MYDNQACPRFRKFWKTLFYPSLEILRNSNQNFFVQKREANEDVLQFLV